MSTDPIWQAEASNASLTDAQTQYHYLHTDHLGTPQLATTKEGTTSWKAQSEAFGAAGILQNQSSITMNLRFPGQYYDEETNSHYNFHRDYRPNLGRYLQSDPMMLAAGINIFTYVEAGPLARKDSYGLFTSGADYALVYHFLIDRSGSYLDISGWCPDYMADAQVEVSMEILKSEIKIQNKKLIGLKGSTAYQIKNNQKLYISAFSIYSFGAGNGHLQDADCKAVGDGCCVESECSLMAKAFDRFEDPIDLCQAWGRCKGIKDIGGVPFNFGLSCPSTYRVKDCKAN